MQAGGLSSAQFDVALFGPWWVALALMGCPIGPSRRLLLFWGGLAGHFMQQCLAWLPWGGGGLGEGL